MFFLEGIFLFSWVKCENNSLRARRETEREREKKKERQYCLSVCRKTETNYTNGNKLLKSFILDFSFVYQAL